MAGNRYFPHMRKSCGSFSRYKFMLQSAVSAFVSDYRDYVRRSFVSVPGKAWLDRKIIVADEAIHVGVQSAERIKWGVSYLGLSVNEDLRLYFFIRTDYSVNNHENQPEFHEAVFRCSVRATGKRLAFELAGWDGTVIRHFWLDRQIKQGTFWPVVDEIQRYLHLGERNVFLPQTSSPTSISEGNQSVNAE